MIVTVNTTMPSSKRSGNIWFIMEVNEDSIPEIHETLAEDGVVSGDRIFTDRLGARTVERSREEILIGVSVIETIRPCHLSFDVAKNPVYVGGKT